MALLTPLAAYAADRPNVLIITVDDMSADSLGAFGCKLADTSPNLDRLAAQGMRFDYAHVQVANCMPSRNVLFSGRYPHNNRVEGFYQVRDANYPVMADIMKSAGYFVGIRGKVGHSTPYQPYDWDLVMREGDRKNAASYKECTEEGIRAAKDAGKPFCLNINISDPHKPFYAEGRRGVTVEDPNKPSRVFTPEEVPIPGFLFDDPVVRKELSHYYSSVRRADDCLAKIMEALDESGEAEQTVIIFLSDHGMPLPFAKTQSYHHSTHTPLVVIWPGVTKAGARDRQHMVSAVDFMPTLLDIVGVEHPAGFDGRSFAPLLRGETQDDREMIVKEYNENSGGFRNPMRGVQTKQYLYIFNPWADGKREMHSATQGTPTYKRMQELAETDSKIAARLELFDHRVMEELYDVEKDPDCLNNLIDDAAHEQELAKLRQSLGAWMVKTSDPMLEVFQQRDDTAAVEAYMVSVEKESASRGNKAERKAKRRESKGNANRRGRVDRRAGEGKRAGRRVNAED